MVDVPVELVTTPLLDVMVVPEAVPFQLRIVISIVEVVVVVTPELEVVVVAVAVPSKFDRSG